MLVKERSYFILLLILLICLLVVTASLLLHQLTLLMDIVFLYSIIPAVFLASPEISTGLKELREARQKNEKSLWSQNKHIIQGVCVLLPALIEVATYFTHPTTYINQPVLENIRIGCISIFLVFALFIDVILTIGYIRSFVNKANPYCYLESISSESKSTQEEDALGERRTSAKLDQV